MKIPAWTCAALALAGCTEMQLTDVIDVIDVSASDIAIERPPDAVAGMCYGKEISPAIFETTTEQVLARAARYGDDGSLLEPAAYRTETLQKIVQERADIWFEVPCGPEKVGDFTASLQRALAARGHYRGRITGELDPRTRHAIRSYQLQHGLDSNKLSLASARRLGLVAIDRESL